jgi:predicted transcriptional regulator
LRPRTLAGIVSECKLINSIKMGYHGNITDQMRAYVIYLGAKKKYSLRKISEKVGVSKSTACRMLSNSKKQSFNIQGKTRKAQKIVTSG